MNLLNNLNNLHLIIRNFQDYFPNSFEKTGILKCGHCNGTGMDKGTNTEKYCRNCRGFGFVNIDEITIQYICPKCEGGGYTGPRQVCPLCNGTGMTDWIRHARGE